MKKILAYLLDYQRKHFDWKLYLSIAAFLAVCIALNYRLDFEDSIIDSYHGKPIKWLWMFLFQTFPYLVVCLLLLAFGKVDNWAKDRTFWLKLVVGFGILAFDRSFYGVDYLSDFFSSRSFHFISRCLNWASSLVVTVLPLLLAYYFLEKDQPRMWYGLSLQKFDARPYLIMLGIAGVFILIGSFFGDIQSYYPRFQHSRYVPFLRETGWSEWMAIGLYELCYGSDFLSVELFFRGYLIFAFTRTLGPYVVLPMIATYCFLHFGKPISESISSVFGGYILGIISLNSRNIWGGVFIHVGVAWLMEFFGWWQSVR
jgi:hypothetical protein